MYCSSILSKTILFRCPIPSTADLYINIRNNRTRVAFTLFPIFNILRKWVYVQCEYVKCYLLSPSNKVHIMIMSKMFLCRFCNYFTFYTVSKKKTMLSRFILFRVTVRRVTVRIRWSIIVGQK